MIFKVSQIVTVLALVLLALYNACSPMRMTQQGEEDSELSLVDYDRITSLSNNAAGSSGSCAAFKTRGWRWNTDDRVSMREDSCLIEQANVVFDRIFREYSQQSGVMACGEEQEFYTTAVRDMNDLWNQVHPMFRRTQSYSSQLGYFNMRLSSFSSVHQSRQASCTQESSDPVEIQTRAAFWNAGIGRLELTGSGFERISRSSQPIVERSENRIVIDFPTVTSGPSAIGLTFHSGAAKIAELNVFFPPTGAGPSVDSVQRVGQDDTGILFRAWGRFSETVTILSSCGAVNVISQNGYIDFSVNVGMRTSCDFQFRFVRGSQAVITGIETGIAAANPNPEILSLTPAGLVQAENRSYAIIKGRGFSAGSNNTVSSSNCGTVGKTYDGADTGGYADLREIRVSVLAQPGATFTCSFQVRRPDGAASPEYSISTMVGIAPATNPAPSSAPVITVGEAITVSAVENRSYVTLKGRNFSINGDNTVTSNNCGVVEKTYDNNDGTGAPNSRQINARVVARMQAFSCNFQVRRPDGSISDSFNVQNMKFIPPAGSPNPNPGQPNPSPTPTTQPSQPGSSVPTCSLGLSATRVANGPNTRGLPTNIRFTRQGNGSGKVYWGQGANLTVQNGFEMPGNAIELPYVGIPAGTYVINAEFRETSMGTVGCGQYQIIVERP